MFLRSRELSSSGSQIQNPIPPGTALPTTNPDLSVRPNWLQACRVRRCRVSSHAVSVRLYWQVKEGQPKMKYLCIAVLSILGVVSASAAEKTLTGKISDSMCGAQHNTAAEHGSKQMSDRDCALACVKEHNAKYVFVS